MQSLVQRLALPLCLGALVLSSPASAQDFTFNINQGLSNWNWSGTTSIGNIEGNPSTAFQLAGTFAMDLGGGGNPVGTGQVVNGNAAVIPDLHGLVPNPVMILPPLALIDITNLSLSYGTNGFNVAANGSFTADWTVTVLTGTLTVTPLAGAPTVTDLAGQMGTPVSNPGMVTQAGAVITMNSNQSSTVTFTDPGSGISATMTLVGTLNGTYSCPTPQSFCQTSANSAGPGALMDHSGSTSWTTNNLTLIAGGLPSGQNGIFYFGPNQIQTPFGDGFRCVGGGVFRLGVQNSGPTGTFNQLLDFTNLAGPGTIAAGDEWNFQAWYRDPMGGGSGFNLSNGLNIKFCP